MIGVQFSVRPPFIMKQNYNEFKGPVRWHDYFSFMVHEFAIILIRRYDFDDHGDWKSTYMFQVLGIRVF